MGKWKLSWQICSKKVLSSVGVSSNDAILSVYIVPQPIVLKIFPLFKYFLIIPKYSWNKWNRNVPDNTIEKKEIKIYNSVGSFSRSNPLEKKKFLWFSRKYSLKPKNTKSYKWRKFYYAFWKKWRTNEFFSVSELDKNPEWNRFRLFNKWSFRWLKIWSAKEIFWFEISNKNQSRFVNILRPL